MVAVHLYLEKNETFSIHAHVQPCARSRLKIQGSFTHHSTAQDLRQNARCSSVLCRHLTSPVSLMLARDAPAGLITRFTEQLTSRPLKPHMLC